MAELIPEARTQRRVTKPITGGGLISSAALNYFGAAVLALTGFFLTPYMLHTLGKSHYGIYALTGALISYVALLDFGLGMSVMKLVSDAADSPDRTRVERLVSTVLALYIVLGCCVAVLLFALYPLIKSDFHVLPSDQSAFHGCYIIAVISVSACFPQAVFTATITAHRHFGALNMIVIGQALLSAAITVVLLELGHGIVALTAGGACVALGGFAARVIVARRRYHLRLSPRHIVPSVLREVATFATWVFVINVAAQIIFDSDTVVVGAILGPASVAVYQVALSPNLVLSQIGSQLSVVTLTASSALRSAGDAFSVRRLFLETTQVATVLMAPFAIAVAAWGDAFIRLWVGERYIHAGPALLLLTLAILEFGIQGSASQTIIAHGRHKVIAIATGIEAVANLTLSVILGERIGITGVALGTLLPTTVTVWCVTLPYAARISGATIWDVGRRVVFPLAQAACLVVILRVAVPQQMFDEMIGLLLAGFALFAAFVGLNLLVLSAERATYREYLLRRLRPLSARS